MQLEMFSWSRRLPARVILLALAGLSMFVGIDALAAGASTDPVFDVDALASTPLDAKVLKKSEADGLVTEEVQFHSHTDAGKRVDIFALLIYPLGAKNAPAVIWNQGGLTQASDYWPKLAAKRGYVGMCIDFPMPNYRSTGGYPIVSGLELTDDPKKAPIYHGAVALIKAVSYLQSRPEVDKENIAMSGLSWGGFYATLMAGVDPRIKAASAMFGCGELQLGNLWWDAGGWDAKRDAAFRARWRATLDPAPRLANRPKTPTYWLTGTNDQFYWLPSVMKTYEGAAGPKGLSLWPNYAHALPGGPADTGLYAWLDVHLKGAPPFPTVGSATVEKGDKGPRATWTFKSTRPIKSADLIISYGDAGNWVGRYWKTLPATIDGETCRADLPAKSPMPYFISGTVISDDGQRHSTPILRVDPAAHGGALDPTAPMEIDGCAEWGGFEEPQLAYFANHGYPKPATDPAAKSGKQSARVKAGAPTAIKDVLYAPGVPHKLTAQLKSTGKPAQVKLHLSGAFDGKPATAEATATAGADWTAGELTLTPPKAVSGNGLALTITVPPGGDDVLVDDVRFEPVTE